MSVEGNVIEREFFHWATADFLKAANNAAMIEFTTSPTSSWYWRGKLANRTWTPQLPEGLGDVADLLAHGKYASELLKEYVFEEVRAAEYGTRPTRRRSMFLFDTAQDPHEYGTAMKLAMTHLFRVTVTSGSLHRAALAALNCNGSLYAEMVVKAREYWSHIAAPSMNTEVLFEGECTMRYVPNGERAAVAT